MDFDYAAILVMLTLASGLIWAADKIWFKKRREALGITKEPTLIDYGRSFFPVLLVVIFLRSFFIEPYRIPSGSMDPTLTTGDFILVNKYTYGVRLPVINKLLIEMGKPQRGDVIVFNYPVNPNMKFIKRVIGLPGDVISYQKKKLTINGKEIPKEFIGRDEFLLEPGRKVDVKRYNEFLPEKTHLIFERYTPGREVSNIIVPEGHYFVMGDNRDDSDDSRAWGFVPESAIVGKAFAIWMSWDGQDKWIRWHRLGQRIN
jgi:signal peptidase I